MTEKARVHPLAKRCFAVAIICLAVVAVLYAAAFLNEEGLAVGMFVIRPYRLNGILSPIWLHGSFPAFVSLIGVMIFFVVSSLHMSRAEPPCRGRYLVWISSVLWFVSVILTAAWFLAFTNYSS